MPFVWSVGTIIGLAIGGMLAIPSVTLPWLFSPSGLFASYGKLSKVADDSSVSPSESPLYTHTKVFTKRVIMIVVALGLSTYHPMTCDHLFPNFLKDSRDGSVSTPRIEFFDIPGGVGLTRQSVGIVMSVNGLIALFIQAVVFPFFATWLGIWHLFIIIILLHPLEYVMVLYSCT